VELHALETQGFGKLIYVGKNAYYCKPHPVSVALNNSILESAKVSHDTYTAKFLDISKMTPRIKTLCLEHHPHTEMLTDLLSQDLNTSQY
jgi:hypothetical protein